MDYLQTLGERIRFYRKANNITQIELAEKLGVASRYISNIEQGYRKPRLDTLVAICIFFGVEVTDIMPLGIEREDSSKEQLIYEIAATCKTLEINQIGIVKTMVSSLKG